MFKYISEILGKFTQGQRITALLIVLFSIVLITLGPSLIQDNDCREVYSELEKQRGDILRLNGEIIQVQTECTNERISREREIAQILNLIEREILDIQEEAKAASSTRELRVIDSDSAVSPPQRLPEAIPVMPNFDNVMENIHYLQKMCGETQKSN